MLLRASTSQIETLVNQIVAKMKLGGRLFYIGAGTSGRLGIVDASECPPTFGVPFDLVNGIIAGGDIAIRKAVENAEDNASQAWKQEHKISAKCRGRYRSIRDHSVRIGGLEACNKIILLQEVFPVMQAATLSNCTVSRRSSGSRVCNRQFRMKAGTAQKLVLNMISTATMTGKVKGNKMVDMQLSNTKLVDRG
jgi:N-acetylmuramic acid 6-phosphate etherase